jgi:adenylate cyclase
MTAPDKADATVIPLRRRAVIVAIDAAGYSRQSEIDEAVAVREITAIAERIHSSAAAHQGRVFNTAGDGFMLEFPAAAAAVAAAEEVQAVERVPLRIGLHVGEVHETPKGDLLGKGVNIAARLMALAEPGSIVVSGEAKRELGPDVAARLHRRGMVQLDKMSERIEAYDLGSPWRKSVRSVPVRWVMMGVGALVALFAGWLATQTLRSESHAIAVLEFRASEPGMRAFTTGLADRLISAMSTSDLQAVHTTAAADDDRVAAAVATGAAFVLDGSARSDGADLLVNARLIDARGSLVIWSNEYRRAADEQNYMQEQIAFDVARVLRCALVSLEPRGGVDAATLAVFMRACQSRGRGDFTPEEGYQAARQVTERAPRFSRGWSLLGMIAAEMSWSGVPGEAETYAVEARSAATRARELDRTNGESYIIEAGLYPAPDFHTRQALIARALQADPDLAAAHAAQAQLYLDVGRTFEALRSMQRAIAIEPLNGDYQTGLPPFLNGAGQPELAQEQIDRNYRIWPNSPGAWWNRLMNSTYVGDPAQALGMIDSIDSTPARGMLREPARSRWRAFVAARLSGDPARIRRAALDLRQLIPGQFSRASVGAALSLAGEVDASYEMAEGMLRANYGAGGMFLPPWRNLRRDPRFMALIKDTPLIPYWRQTGRWPDFCNERDLPYDCEAEAARVLPP